MKKLKKILKDAGITQMEISKELDIKSLSTINLKINGKAEFTTKEANTLKNYINEKTNKNYSLEDLFLS
mgnify:CR=1 FL=1